MFKSQNYNDQTMSTELPMLTDNELDEVSGGLIWLAAALVGFCVGAAVGAVMK